MSIPEEIEAIKARIARLQEELQALEACSEEDTDED